MKHYGYFFGFFFISVCLSVLNVKAFEPVSIDEFFKKYPDERPVQPTMSAAKKNTYNSNTYGRNHRKNTSEIEIIDQDIPVTALKYPQVQILLLDRILGRSEIIDFIVGETKPVNALFDVTILDCLERKTEFGSATQAIEMRVSGFANSKPETKKTILYDDIFYIQMPGFKGFEHSIYDIRPIKCTGTPETITLDEPIENKEETKENDIIKSEQESLNNKDINNTANKENNLNEPIISNTNNQEKTVTPPIRNSVDDVMGKTLETKPDLSTGNSEDTIKNIIQDTDNDTIIPNPPQVPVPVPVE